MLLQLEVVAPIEAPTTLQPAQVTTQEQPPLEVAQVIVVHAVPLLNLQEDIALAAQALDQVLLVAHRQGAVALHRREAIAHQAALLVDHLALLQEALVHHQAHDLQARVLEVDLVVDLDQGDNFFHYDTQDHVQKNYGFICSHIVD